MKDRTQSDKPTTSKDTPDRRSEFLQSLLGPLVVGLVVLVGQSIVQPWVAEKTESRTQRWQMKRELFARALTIVDGLWSNLEWTNPAIDRQEGPSIGEVRAVHGQLHLVCQTREVIDAFEHCVRISKRELSMDAVADLRNAMRRELEWSEEMPPDREKTWIGNVTMKQ